MYAVGEVLKNNRRLIIFLVILVALFGLLYALRSAVVPFVFGWVLAQLIMPLISWVERSLPGKGRWQQTKRVSLIILIFLVFLILVAVLSFIVVTAVVGALAVLIENAPQYIAGGMLGLQQWAEDLRQQFPPEMRQQVDQMVIDAGMAVGRAIQDAFVKGASFMPTTFGVMFGFAALPLFLFYILKDWEKLGQTFYSALPPWVAVHTKNIISIIDSVLVRYIRAQVVLGAIVAYLSFIGLLFLVGIRYAPALAALAGVTELIPTLGPWIGGAAAVIVTLAIAPEHAVWVALLFLGVQLLENNLLVPRIQGAYLHVHPAMAIVLLVLGAYIAGFWGLVLAIPLAATTMEIYKYIRASAGAEAVQQEAQ
ncbi:AI-2E family transporter [Chloroflexota bacterium]